MSKLVAFAAIQGAYNIVSKAEGTLKKALDKYGPDQKIEFPQYRLLSADHLFHPGYTGQDLGGRQKTMDVARKLLPAHVKNMYNLPYLGPLLDAGMATLFAEEIAECIRYLEDPNFYLVSEDIDEASGKIWLGAAEDTVFRKRGVEFVDGTAPGFAAIVGAAPDPETAKWIAEEYQKRTLCLYVCQSERTTFSEQLIEAGVQIGWNTRLVPLDRIFRPRSLPLVLPTGRPWPSAGSNPAIIKRCCCTIRTGSLPLSNALGDVGAEWAANAAGCVNWGFPDHRRYGHP